MCRIRAQPPGLSVEAVLQNHVGARIIFRRFQHIVLNAGDMRDKGKAIGRISCDRMRSDCGFLLVSRQTQLFDAGLPAAASFTSRAAFRALAGGGTFTSGYSQFGHTNPGGTVAAFFNANKGKVRQGVCNGAVLRDRIAPRRGRCDGGVRIDFPQSFEFRLAEIPDMP